MNNSDYDRIAKAVANVRLQIFQTKSGDQLFDMAEGTLHIAYELADVLAEGVSRFPRKRFLRNCGLLP